MVTFTARKLRLIIYIVAALVDRAQRGLLALLARPGLLGCVELVQGDQIPAGQDVAEDGRYVGGGDARHEARELLEEGNEAFFSKNNYRLCLIDTLN